MKRILIVDDEKEIRDLIAETLKKDGIASIQARDADECLSKIQQNRDALPDLIVLDLNLPGISGWDVCRILKKEEETRMIPIVMVTGHFKTSSDTVFGFEHGIDDYILKPFNPDILLARIKAILRRTSSVPAEEKYLSSPDKKIFVDVSSRTVKLTQKKKCNGGETPDLTPKEFELLCLFLKKPEQLLTRSAITGVVWQQEYYDTSRTVDKHIETLRKKLGSFGERIITMNGAGYKFATGG